MQLSTISIEESPCYVNLYPKFYPELKYSTYSVATVLSNNICLFGDRKSLYSQTDLCTLHSLRFTQLHSNFYTYLTF